MDLALLREERGRGADGAVTFVFGKATRVVFVDEDDEVVRALREPLASRQDDEEVGRSRRPGTSRGGVA